MLKMKNKRDRKDKKVLMFLVTNEDDLFVNEEKGLVKFKCITYTKDQAIEYIETALFMNHKDHYKMWCELRNLELGANSWNTYKKVTGIHNPYFYKKVYFDYSTLASILRVQCDYVPLGCSFESPEEQLFSLTKMLNSIQEEEPQKQVEEEPVKEEGQQ